MMRLFNISDSGVNVTEETVKGITALSRAIEILANSIAGLPFHVYTKSGGNITTLDTHPVNYILNISPNHEQTPHLFWYSMIFNAIMRGGGGAQIIRNDAGTPVSLRLMRYGCTPYKPSKDAQLFYYDNEDAQTLFPEDVLYIPGILVSDGTMARSIIQTFKAAFGETLAAHLLAANFYKQGPMLGGVYTYIGPKPKEGTDAHAYDIANYFGGIANAGKVLPIANGDKFQQLNPLNLQQSQIIEHFEFSITEVARITGVPSWMLELSDKQSYNFSENSAKAFLTYTLDPWLTKRDQECRAKLLLMREAGRIHIETAVDETLWMLPKDRAEYWWKLFQMGAKSPDEIRAYLNENKIEGGSEYFVQQNLMPLSTVKQYFEKQTAPADNNRSYENGNAKSNGSLNGVHN